MGAGCAGLSLAVRLLESVPGARMHLLEPRAKYTRDRTWCFFNVVEHPFSEAIANRWSRWTVADRHGAVTRTARDLEYQHIPADAFYDLAQRRLRAGDVNIELGQTVTSVEDRGDYVEVKTERGDRYRAGVVFDSRPEFRQPPSARPDDIRLLQHFRGWFLRTDEPSFDPSCAILMDFRVHQSKGIHFIYVLPFSEREALVEDTFFSDTPLAREDYEASILRYLKSKSIGSYQITDTEEGVIPMTTQTFEQRPSPRVYRIGLAGGMARPSTGYAFLGIQRYSKRLAEAFALQELPGAPPPQRVRTALMDRVFLSYVHSHPEEAPALYTRLFERVPPEIAARFLTEASSIGDDLRIMAALPTPKLAPEAARTIRRLLDPKKRSVPLDRCDATGTDSRS
ncbi:MAG: lycopene cyclase family protein [Myxococcota bacterium]